MDLYSRFLLSSATDHTPQEALAINAWIDWFLATPTLSAEDLQRIEETLSKKESLSQVL
jgi:hypothetical protein